MNKLGRKGAVWADRHHRRELTTPSEVRSAMVYVLQNYRRHGAQSFRDRAYLTILGRWPDALAPYPDDSIAEEELRMLRESSASGAVAVAERPKKRVRWWIPVIVVVVLLAIAAGVFLSLFG